MKYSSFVIALLLNVTFADGYKLRAEPVAAKDAPKDAKKDEKAADAKDEKAADAKDEKAADAKDEKAADAKDAKSEKAAPKKEEKPIGFKSTTEYEKEDKDTAKELKAAKIKKIKESLKADKVEVPKPLDDNPILESLQAGDALEKKQKKEAEDKLGKGDLTSKQVPVLPAKMWKIDEAKPLAEKEEKPDPEDVKDDEKCKFSGDVDEKFEKLLEAYKKASDIVENEGYKNKWKKDNYEALILEAKNVITFVRSEETKLKKDEGLKTLSLKDTGDVLVAQSHHGITMLSGHISRILDEVHDFYDLLDSHKAAVTEEKEAEKAAKAAEEEEKKDEKKEEEKKDDTKEEKKEEKKENPLTPAMNVQKLVDDL
jgi:hypothetical protein